MKPIRWVLLVVLTVVGGGVAIFLLGGPDKIVSRQTVAVEPVSLEASPPPITSSRPISKSLAISLPVSIALAGS